ncbi:MAG: amidohydrolase [Anaerolineaceae bacterium]|nr:amidohydrolase [Anaerolineaceae bacterium]
MDKADLLLTHALIVTQDKGRAIIPDGAIAIWQGRIAALGATGEIASRFKADETLDMTGKIVFPGLVNTHDHLFQVATKGLGEDMPVEKWVAAVTSPTALSISPEEIYIFVLTGCLELIHSGVTTVVDMNYKGMQFKSHDENIRAMTDSGLRGRYTTTITDYGKEYNVLPQMVDPIEWYIEEYTRLFEKYPPTDRLAVWFSIGAPWTITREGQMAIKKVSDETNTPIVMHINENYADNETIIRRYGKPVIPFYDEIGFLSPKLLAIHCVEMSDTDIELFVKHDVKVSHNPVSNMYLGSGIAPVMKMHKAGLTISLGVDGAGSNNSQDMLETLKCAALLQKVGAKDASAVDAQTVLDWATLGGAKALGLEKEIGSLEAGKRADLFAIALNTPKVVPVHDPVASLIYSCGQQNVVLTVADGKVLMKDSVIQHIDEAGIIAQCQEAALALATRCGSNSKVKRGWWGNVTEKYS